MLDFSQSKKVQNFVNLPFRFGMAPPSKKPARVTKNTITARDHIITNSILRCDFKTGIIKANLSDHYPIMLAFKSKGNNSLNRTLVKCIRAINEHLIEASEAATGGVL